LFFGIFILDECGKALSLYGCGVIDLSVTAVASVAPKTLNSAKKTVENVQQVKTAVTHEKQMEKSLSSQQCAQERVVDKKISYTN
jgi:hypothetical protein